MTRGMYSDPRGAKGVLDALGGRPAASPPSAARDAQLDRRRAGREVVLLPSDDLPWSVKVGVALFQRTGVWPWWFARVVDPRGMPPTVPERYERMADVASPLGPPLVVVPSDVVSRKHQVYAGSPHDPDPRLCHHGQRRGECGSCVGW